MYHGQRIARMLAEKDEMDYILMNKDYSEWYNVHRSFLPSFMVECFYQFHHDGEAQDFLNKSLETSNTLCLQFYYALASSFLSLFLTKTSINGVLGRGGMFIFSRNQLRVFLDIGNEWDRSKKKLLDLGAGDGQVTEVLTEFFGNVTVTEASKVMLWRLQRRGFTTVDKDLWPHTGPYDLVSALNLLDRHYNPHALLQDLHLLTSRWNCLLLVAVVLPLKQYVEFHPYRQSTTPDTFLSLNGNTFEEQAVSLMEDVFIPADFALVKWGKLPYLCEGDYKQAYYQLNDAVFLLRPIARRQPYEVFKSPKVSHSILHEEEAL